MKRVKTNSATLFFGLVLTLSSLLLTACTTNVTVTGNYPSALTTPMPYHAGLVMDNEFNQYVYESGLAQDVTMALGQSQSKLFNQVFSDLFTQTTKLQSKPGKISPEMDLLIIPHVEEVQLAMPFETRLNVFEVWLKYNIQVFDKEGEPIADWLMSSYGKTQTRFLKSEEEALNQATTAALRDAGVRLIIGFKKIPEISAWLDNQSQTAQTKPSEGEG